MKVDAITILGPDDSRLAAHLEERATAAGMHVTRSASAADVQASFAAADAVIDANVVMSPDQREALAAGERMMRPQAILCVCCHATSATSAAASMSRPERGVGFGLLVPCGERKTVEMARAIQTSDAAVDQATDLWLALGHEPVFVGDGGGLVVARVVACLANEAAFAVMEGVASAHDIDTAMRLGTGYPRGPLAWCDLVGARDIVATLDALAAEHGDDRFRAAPLLRRMAAAGATWE